MKNGTSHAFGSYELNPRERSLTRDGVRVTLPPKAFDILVVLVENAGELIDNKEMLELVWPDSFVEEANIQVQISAIRKVIDEKGTGTFIETVPKVGYRFRAGVKVTRIRDVLKEANDFNNGGNQAAGTLAEENDSNPTETGNLTTDPWGRPEIGRALTIVSVSIVALALISGLAWLLVHSTNSDAFGGKALKIDRITNSGRIQNSGISPNGRFIAYVLSLSDGKKALYLRDLFTEATSELTPPAIVDWWSNPTFSRDNKYIYYSIFKRSEGLKGVLFRISVAGGEPEMILSNVVNAISFAPDGDSFTFIGNNEGNDDLKVASVRDLLDRRGEPKTIASFKYPEAVFQRLPAWSPDGKTIAYSIGSFAVPNSYELIGISPDGQNRRTLSKEKWGFLQSIVWLHDSRRLMIAANKTQFPNQTYLWIVGEDGAATQITDDFNGYVNISISDDSLTVAAQRFVYDTNIYLSESPEQEKLFFDAATFRPVTKEIEVGNGIGGMDWAEDGRIFYTNRDSSTIFSIDANGENKRTIEVDSGILPIMPRVSRDGGFLIFTAGVKAEIGVFRLDLKNGQMQRLANDAVNAGAAITPDGLEVIYSRFQRDGHNVLKKISSTVDGRVFTGKEQQGYTPTISPSGEFVVYVCEKDNDSGTCVISVPKWDEGPRFYSIRSGGSSIQPKFGWLHASSAFLVNYEENGVMNIRAVPLDGSAPYDITNFTDDYKIQSFGISPDGKKLAVVRGIRKDDVVLIKNFQ